MNAYTIFPIQIRVSSGPCGYQDQLFFPVQPEYMGVTPFFSGYPSLFKVTDTTFFIAFSVPLASSTIIFFAYFSKFDIYGTSVFNTPYFIFLH